MIYFGHPTYLWLLVVPVLFAGLFAYYISWYRNTRRQLGEYELIESMSRTASFRKRIAQGIIVTLALVLLAVAAAQPKWGRKDTEVQQQGIDLVFALDVSNSMRAQDIKPSRFAAAKNQMNQLVNRLTGHRVGLVVFTSVSFVQSPLTSDYSAVEFYLEKLEPGQMPTGGTSFSTALDDAIDLLTGKESEGKSKKLEPAQNQVIVLISDGGDHSTDLHTAIDRAKKQNIRIATVGMGTTEGAKIPVYGPEGNMRGYKQNDRGEVINSELEADKLKSIASETDGLFVQYNSQTSVSERLKGFINRLRKTKFQSEKHRQYINRYHYFLIPGSLLMLIALLLGNRRRDSRDVSFAGLLRRIAPFGALLLLLTGCGDLFRESLPGVQQGNKHLEDGEYKKALESYKKAPSQGSNPMLNYNKGLAQMELDKHEPARKAFSISLGASETPLRFKSLFQMGVTLAKQKDWETSYTKFKEALKLAEKAAIPKKLLGKTKHNLEYVFREVHPTCESLEDKLEPNNSKSEATTYKRKKAKKLTKCGGDPDWYKFGAHSGSELTIRANLKQLRDKTFLERPFLPDDGSVSLTVVDTTTGEQLAATKEASQSSESSATFELDLELEEGSNLPPRRNIAVELASPEPFDYRYSLDIFVEPPCPEADDDLEPNDSREEAVSISEQKKPRKLYSCPGDADWYRVEPDLGDSIFVDIQPSKQRPNAEPPELDIDLFRDGEKQSARQEGRYLTGGWSNLDSEEPIYIRVEGKKKSTKGPYKMKLHHFKPCMLGDDDYEENDSISQAAQLGGKRTRGRPKRVFRYLRLCSQNRDFFRVRAKKRRRPQRGKAKKKPTLGPWGLSIAGTPNREVDIDLAMLSTDSGESIGEQLAGEKLEKLSQKASLTIDRAVTPPEDQQRAVLRVSGDQTFYHLANLNSRKSQRNRQSKQNKKKNKNKKQKQSDKNKDKQSKSNKKRKSDKKKRQNQSDNKKKRDQKQSQSKKQKDSEKEKSNEKKKAEQKSKRQKEIEQILRSIRDTDKNYQMKKQRDMKPQSPPSKNW